MEEPSRERYKFGEVAVALGLLSLQQVESAVARHTELVEAGQSISLGEFLIQERLLEVEEVRLVLNEQGVEILVCSEASCAKRFNITDYDPSKAYQCKTCGERLGLPGMLDRSTHVDMTAGDSAATWRVPDDLSDQGPRLG